MKISKQLAKILLNEIDEKQSHEGFECIDEGKWEDDGKYDFLSKIFKHTDTNKFYALYDSRSGSYFSDYHHESEDWGDEVDFTEVEPKEKVTIEWVAVK